VSEEATLTSKRIYQGRVLNLRVDTVQLPSGRITSREIVEHKGAVAVVALDEADNVLLVEQFRKPVEMRLLEIPAGTREIGEEGTSCAHRELREETGYRAGKLEHLGSYYSSPGFLTEWMEVYLATDLAWEPLPSAPDEVMEVEKITLHEALELIRAGRICDAKSIIGLLLARDHLLAHREHR